MRRLLAAVLPKLLPAYGQQHRDFHLTCAAAAAGQPSPAHRTRGRSDQESASPPPAVPAESGPEPRGSAGHGSEGSKGAVEIQNLKLRQLEAALSHHGDLYYNQQRADISDAAYDDLKREYRLLAGRLRGVAPEEVALPVGAPVAASALRKVPHRVPMLSLAAVNSREELAAWLAKTLAKLPGGGTAGGTAATAAAAASGGGRVGVSSDAGVVSSGKKTKKETKRRAAGSASGGGSGEAGGGRRAATQGSESGGGSASPAAAYSWVVEPKVDGLAVRALYRRTAKGTYELEEAATRGDGAVGEDITHNARHGAICGLPLAFQLSPSGSGSPGPSGAGGGSPPPLASAAPRAGPGTEWVDVRGEVFLRTADLQLVNDEYSAAGQTPFANTRNAAAGAVRLLDPAECRRRRLSFVAYAALAPPLPPPSPPAASGTRQRQRQRRPDSEEVAAAAVAVAAGGGVAGPLHGSHWDTLRWLQAAGFAVSPDNRLCGSAEEAVQRAEEWMALRASLGYDADGAVIKLDDTTLYDTLGTAGSDPRWAVAWKFPAGEAVTRLEGVELTVGRQGQITPVALLQPVALGGVTIRRASLHNVGLAAALGLHLGDAVVLRRSGDVIPQVMRVLPELRPAAAPPWRPPSACPACGGPVLLVAAAGAGAGDQLLCDNPGCGAKSERRLLLFATVCLKGSNVSKKVVPQLVAAGLLSDLPDFYNLDPAALAALPGFGPSRQSSLDSAVAASRAMPSSLLLRGLNIRLVGEVAAAALGRAFPRLDELAAATPERISEAAGVGPAVAAGVAEWFGQPANRELLRRLHEAGVACVAGGSGGTQQQQQGAARGPTLAARSQRKTRKRPSSGSDSPPAAAGQPSGLAGEAAAGARATAEQEEAEEARREQPAAEAAPAGGVRLTGLGGLAVCVTGTLQGPDGNGMRRSELQALLEAAGAEFHKSIKATTQVLVVGLDAGHAKPQAAARRGVRVVEEGEFWWLFGGGAAAGGV